MRSRRQLFRVAVGLALLPFSLSLGGEATDKPVKRIVLVRGDSVDKVIFEHTVLFMRRNISAVVEVAQCPEGLTKLPAAKQFASLQGLLDKDDLCAVALAREPGSIAERILLTRETRSGVVNISRLQLEIVDQEKDTERLARLIDKETLRTIGYILGLSQCLNPHCAMSGYKLKPGDRFGRNYCPPCHIRMEKRLGVEGGPKKTHTGPKPESDAKVPAPGAAASAPAAKDE